jgi:capsular exopolysaccharide synthesis family protein
MINLKTRNLLTFKNCEMENIRFNETLHYSKYPNSLSNPAEHRVSVHAIKSENDIDFQHFWLSLKRRWLPAAGVFGAVTLLTIPAAFLQKLSYETTGKLLLKPDATSSITGVGKEIKEFAPLTEGGLPQEVNPAKTQSEVILSNPLLERTVAALNLKDEQGKPLSAEFIKHKLKVKNIAGTDVLTVSYKSTNPHEAAAVVNKLMRVYIENNILTNRGEAVKAGDFIAMQLPRTEATVRQAEVALRRFKEQNNVVALDEESKSAVAVIQELQTQINDTQAKLADANARFADLQNKVDMNSHSAIALNSLNQSPGVQNVLQELQQVEDQLAVQRTRFQEDYPTIINLKLKEATLKALLQERVGQAGSVRQVPSRNLQIGESKQKLSEELVKSEVERSGLINRLAKLFKTQANYKQRVSVLPKLEQQQRELERRLAAAQSTYEILLKKIQEVRLAENQNMGNARIIEPALVPQKPSLLKPAVIIILGVMLSILLSAATVVILEVRDTSIKTLKEAKELFGYTLLGVIPSLKKKTTPRGRDTESTIPELPVRDTPRLPICEAYRMLQANLKFLSSDKALKVIVVTSSIPKEGKSKVSANLAATVAQMGRRVLLVDADMRHPSQHHIWTLTNAVGLSDVIVGQAEFEAAVEEVMPNMDVLTAGVIPPNPLALLDSKRMASLIEDFSETYDFVVIDAPPLVVAADALTLGKITDGILLVARPGVVNSTSAVAAKESLERSGQNVLGLVVNGVSLENESGSYFYYSQEYHAEENLAPREKATSEFRKM